MPSEYQKLNTAFIVELLATGQGEQRGTSEKVGGQRIYLPHLPESFGLGREVTYDKNPIRTMPEPMLIYNNTSPLGFELKWSMVAGESEKNRLGVIQQCALLHSWALPSGAFIGEGQAGAAFRPPSVLMVVVGPWLRVRCLLESVDTNMQEPWGDAVESAPWKIGPVTWGGPKSVAESDLMPTSVDVTCKFLATQRYNQGVGVGQTKEMNKIVDIKDAEFSTGNKVMDSSYVRGRFYGSLKFKVIS